MGVSDDMSKVFLQPCQRSYDKVDATDPVTNEVDDSTQRDHIATLDEGTNMEEEDTPECYITKNITEEEIKEALKSCHSKAKAVDGFSQHDLKK